jgi:hypothetical protein
LFWHILIGFNKDGIKGWILADSIRRIVYQQCISKVNSRIPREKIKKVFMMNSFIKSGMIEVFTETFEGKLHYVIVNLALDKSRMCPLLP